MKDEEKRAISVIQEISRTVVFERNIGALLQNVLDLLHRRMGAKSIHYFAKLFDTDFWCITHLSIPLRIGV